ncbi:Unknown protein [Striga hermonthica]|uniref:Uncharacterized protein n=1 Tax=Striga hermonthica TaxID=68872 RepID=A0A9N7R8C3_STRHE|nr:Unknown protein [Striga hermonthica]
MMHTLRDCSNASSVWKRLVPRVTWDDFNALDLEDWLVINLTNARNLDVMDWDVTFGLALWRIWNARNRRIFKGEASRVGGLLKEIETWKSNVSAITRGERRLGGFGVGREMLSSPCGSYSSGFSTPLYSDFESEDGDFIAELSRQMAERMLQDEDEEEEEKHGNKKSDPSSGGSAKKNGSIRLDTSVGAVDGGENGIDSGRAGLDYRFPPIHDFELKNQVPRKEDQFVGGRRVKRTETTQPKTQRHHHHRQTRYKGRNGSGMQAVFLGGSGSVNVQPGTGVFLPRLNTDPAEPRKKSGCSIVLMPTRVLQTLELHFKQRHQSITSLPLNDGGSLVHSWPKLGESTISKEQYSQSQLEKDPPNGDDMQLPQEWTYEQ